jgi:hypothetical protein
MQALDRKFTKTYSLPAAQASFKHTTMVRHKGVVIAFAMDDQRHIYYSVLDLERDDVKSPLDSQYWNDKPQELRFPDELGQVGFSAVGVQKMPTVRKNGVIETVALDDKEKDLFLSTTARLTADAPFQVLSDEKHVYVFRQAVAYDHPNNIKLSETVAVVDRTLLCDRFVLVGGELKPKFETRYQRSRNKDLPADRKDSLGYEDLEKKPFYEPTQELAFVRNLMDGQFSVVLLPTSLPDVQRWQIFAYNNATQRMDSFNIARSQDGLLNTRGTRYYTSPEAKYQSSVFERKPGNCPFTNKPLVEIVSQSGFAESALAFNGMDEYVAIPHTYDLDFTVEDNFSLEVWVKVDTTQEGTDKEQSIVDGKGARFPFTLRYSVESGQILALRSDGQKTLRLASNVSINDAKFHHVAFVKQDSTLYLYIDGEAVGSTTDAMQPTTQDGLSLYFGSMGGKKTFFRGQLDEVRLWKTGRSQSDLQAEMHHRLIGNEINLIGYWRFDEGTGTRVFDQTDSANHGQFFTNRLSKGRNWVKSDAPVGEHPGVRRSSFAIDGRQIVSGCTSLLYYQQEQAETGYTPTEKKPIKRNARVMLAVPTAPEGQNDSAKNTIAVLDFAVSRDGGLVQVPDQLPLTTLDRTSIGDRSISDILSTISQLEQAEQDFTSSIREKNSQIQALQQKLATFPICDATLVSNSANDGIHFFNGNKTAKSVAPSTIQAIANSQWRGLPADWAATGIDAIVPWGTQGLKCYIFKGNQCLYYDAMRFQPVPGFEQPRLIRDVFTLPINSPVDWSTGIDAAIRYDLYTAYFFKDNQCLLFNGLVGAPNDQELTRAATTGAIPIKQDFPDVPTALRNLDAVYVKEDSSVLFLKGDKYASSRRHANNGIGPIYKGYASLVQEGLRPLVTFYETMRSSLQESIYQVKDQISIAEANLKEVRVMLVEQRKLLENINGDVHLKMPLLHVDPTGLTLSGALLGFAWSDRPPLLFESVDGRVSLYFRGQNGQFFVAYYDVLAQRSQYTLEAKTESGSRSLVKLIARSPVQGMSTIEVYDADNTESCAVRITNSETGIVESWKRVPRQVQAFADVLNGTAGTPGYEVPYDYAANARTNKPTHTLEAGSLFFRVNSDDASGKIVEVAGKQTALQDTSNESDNIANCWFSDSQDSALSFSEGVPALSASATQVSQFAFNDDLTLEAWVNHGSFSAGTARILNYNSGKAETSYALGLFRDAATTANAILEEQYGVFVGVGDYWLKTAPVPSVQQWRHIAAVFQQSYALKFSSADDVVNCGNDITLDISEDLTIEAFFRLEGPLNASQAILTKGRIDDGTDQDCAYSLYINRSGELVFAFEDKDHGNQFISWGLGSITPRISYRVAVTRTHKTDPKPIPDGQTEISTSCDFNFHISPVGGSLRSGSKTYKGSIASNKQPLEIGQAMARVASVGDEVKLCHLNGEISEVRIWNRALPAEEVCRNINGDEKGLVSWWRFEENQGTRAYDSKGNNHGTIANATWTKSRDPLSSRLTVYINGESVLTTPWTQDKPTYGQASQFTIGEQSRFQGQLDDIRIWNTTRTEEQIQDNLFRRVNGDFEHLLAYYHRNGGQAQVLPDRSGNQLDLTLPPASNYFVLSTAPISSETAQVRNALAQVQTPFHTTIDAAPAVQEYGDMQFDSNGMTIGVMKRCYAYIKDGKWHLVTGYKVSDLELEWVGQAQYEPQLVGFIEGAPPVPSENLTIRDANQGEIYENVSAIELTEADRVTYTYAASKENGLDTSLTFKAGVGGKSKTSAGIALITSIEEIAVQVGVQGSINISRGWLNEQRVGFAKGTNRLSRLATQGNWEDPSAIQYEDLGRRFILKNVGFALVKSKTADIFALRLKHREPEKRVTIALSMRPNPDIPEDWNIITFPINPYYTKQGTLDGKIGNSPDQKDYPTATDYSSDRSYFKPIEAYALKHRIEREQQQLAADSLHYSTDPIKGMKNQEEMSKRLPTATQMNLFNTYVWTADGGLFAETQNTMNFKQEVVGGSFSVSGMAGMFATADITIGKATVAFELEALMGGHLNLISQRSQDSETGFEVNVALDVERDIMIKGRYDDNNNPVKCPGKVDGYRFMTFYLQPDIEHFKDFENKVVDRTWLESSEPNARALKYAMSNKSGTPWRVMHRVTYVSRVLPQIGQSTTKTEEALRAANIESNWELIKTLEPFVKAKAKSYPELKQAVEQAIDQYLPELSSPTVKADVVRYMSLYYQVFDR